MSLITKYRPNTLKAVVGNKETVDTLQTMLDAEERKHTFLIHGARGCGKTTLGRIVARHIGCDMDNDFTEVDTAALNGAEPARQLRKNCQYKGFTGGVRVWLLDECHRMSAAAQEILLKTFEEPPPHVYFILATTDPQKLKPTVRDRCAQLQVGPLQDDECISFLKKIARREKKKVPLEIIETIVEKAQCRPRSSLALLEKLINKDEAGMLEVLSKEQETDTQAIELCRALMQQKKWAGVCKILNGLKKEDPEGIRRLVMGYCSSVLLKSDNIQAFEIMDNFKEPFYNTGWPDLVYACYNANLVEEDE